jgi:hypothetical protein
MDMASNNVLRFVPLAPSVVHARSRHVRPAKVIPLWPRQWVRHHSRTANVLFAIAGVALWAAAIVLGIAAFRVNRDWMGDLMPGWSWWPM